MRHADANANLHMNYVSYKVSVLAYNRLERLQHNKMNDVNIKVVQLAALCFAM
jgi:hypothetical protein